MIAIVAVSVPREQLYTEELTSFSTYQEADRADAGRWVNANVPQDFRVFTMWGNPAYHAHRQVIDGSFLNRRFENVSLVEKYEPEILVLQGHPQSAPSAPQFGDELNAGYEVVKVFAKSHAAGMDYYFGVLARRDVVQRIAARDPPIDLMPYLRNISVGDELGIVRPRGLGCTCIQVARRRRCSISTRSCTSRTRDVTA